VSEQSLTPVVDLSSLIYINIYIYIYRDENLNPCVGFMHGSRYEQVRPFLLYILESTSDYFSLICSFLYMFSDRRKVTTKNKKNQLLEHKKINVV
jgi:hypothetical protein